MATRSGGEALGLQCGKLACGQQADLIGFRVSPSYSGSWFDVPFESHRHEVDFYMVDGNLSPFFTATRHIRLAVLPMVDGESCFSYNLLI